MRGNKRTVSERTASGWAKLRLEHSERMEADPVRPEPAKPEPAESGEMQAPMEKSDPVKPESAESARTESDGAQDTVLPPTPEDVQSAADRAAEQAYARGRAAGVQSAEAEISALKSALAAANEQAQRRETEIRCGRFLRERGLDEDMTAFIMAPGETDVEDEILMMRVSALSGAVEAAAVRQLQKRAEGLRPGCGEKTPLTGHMIRNMPLAQLAEIMK